jgi:hypothetical protein
MKTLNNKKLILAALLMGSSFLANAQVVYWNGLGRALVTGNYMNGNALGADASKGQSKDTTSARKATDGYTIFDLGVNAQPSEALRAQAIIRLQNRFGGFYGDGSQLLFRQIRLDGIIGKKVRYEIGDIDLGLTKYTLFNSSEIYNDYESSVLASRRSVVEYENYNYGNKWRMQGVNLETSLRFNQAIEKIGLKFFATRNFRYVQPNSPDRFIIGGRADVMQSRNIIVGGNFIYGFETPKSVTSAQTINQYTVLTGDFKLGHFTDKVDYSLYGELGSSSNQYKNGDAKVASSNDFFYDLGASAKYKPWLLKVFAQYRNVGADFFSPGAQTRRINDYANLELFNAMNNAAGGVRPTTLLDYVSDQSMRNLNISSTLMTYNPAFNILTPYGQATPNRKGLTFGATIGNDEKLVKASASLDLLSEVVSEGDSIDKKLRKYTGIKAGASLNAHKLLQFEKHIILTLGFRSEQVKRDGKNTVDLSSSLIDAGLDFEVVEKLDLLFGYKMLSAKGNEYIYARNSYNQTVGVPSYYNVNMSQALISYGARYRFSKNTYFTINGVNQMYKDKDNSNLNFKIDQVFFNYTMVF